MCSSGGPGTHSVDQAGLRRTEELPLHSTSKALELKAWATAARAHVHFHCSTLYTCEPREIGNYGYDYYCSTDYRHRCLTTAHKVTLPQNPVLPGIVKG